MNCCHSHSNTQNHSERGEASVSMYSCPMHPEVKQKEPGQCPECGMNLVPSDRKTPRLFLWGSIILLVILSLLFLFSKSTGKEPFAQSQTPAQREMKSDDGKGGITVTASAQESGGALKFFVQLDTHSVSLDDFDPVGQVILISRNGNSQIPAAVVSSGSGHHREFTLSFAGAEKPYRLVVKNLAGVPARELLWE